MADQKLTELDEETSPAGTDLVYVVTDPDGTAASKKVKIENLPGAGGGGDRIETVDGDAQAVVLTDVNGIGEARSILEAKNEESGGYRSVTATARASGAGAAWTLYMEAGSLQGVPISQGVPIAVELDDDGAPRVGFFDATPVERPQIDGSTATVADLCAALHTLGLIEDTSL